MSFLNDFFDVRSTDVEEMDRIYADYISLHRSHSVAAVQEAVKSCSAPEMCHFMMRSSIDCIKEKYREVVDGYDFACLEDWPDEDEDDVWFNFQDSHYAGFLGRHISDTTPGALASYGGAEGVVKDIIQEQMDRRIRLLASELGIHPDPFGYDASEEMYQVIKKYNKDFNECDLSRFYDPETLSYMLPDWVLKEVLKVTGANEDLKGNPF